MTISNIRIAKAVLTPAFAFVLVLFVGVSTHASDCDLVCGNVCLIHNPLNGNCVQSVHDGICETRKATACNAEHAQANARAAAAAAARVVTEPTVQGAGAALAAWLLESRNTSINGAQPIPDSIRQALAGYIDEQDMNIVRFRVGDAGTFNFAGMTMRYGNIGGDVGAVTLIDVVVFRNASDAYGNPGLWAHELTHVKQYRLWGLQSFAVSYVRNWHDVEDPAYGIGNGYASWAATHNVGANDNVPPDQSVQPQLGSPPDSVTAEQYSVFTANGGTRISALYVHSGNSWQEMQNGTAAFSFEERYRADGSIYLYDPSRPGTWVRLTPGSDGLATGEWGVGSSSAAPTAWHPLDIGG